MFTIFILATSILFYLFWYWIYFQRAKGFCCSGSMMIKPGYTVWLIISFYLVFSVGLRSQTIGIDSPSYVDFFEKSSLFSLQELFYRTNTEWGFLLINKYLSFWKIPYGIFFLVVSVVSIIPVMQYIYRDSKYPLLSLIIYFSIVYPWTYSAMRQCMAIGLTTFSIKFIKNRRFFLFLLVVLLASSIHKTAIIFLPMYFTNRIPFNKKMVFIVLAVCCLVLAYRSVVGEWMTKYARILYEVDSTTGGIRYTLILFVTLFMSIFLFSRIQRNEPDIVPEFYAVMILPFLFRISSFNPVVYRLTWYFEVLSFVFIPNYLSLIRTRWIRISGILVYMVLYIYLMFNTVVSTKMTIYQSWLFI